MSETLQRPPCEPLVAPGGMDLHARDMTATFSADCPLRFVQWKLAEIGQWLPVDGSPDATLGQLVEQNSTGPLRLGFGGWRDLLLGVQFTNGMGELITAGGRTVKNVAGYDLTKFMVGGHGIFGRLVTITTRTYALPEAAMLVRAAADAGAIGTLMVTPLRPQWSLLVRDGLLLGFLGDERTIEYYQSVLPQYQPVPLLRAKSERHSVTDHNALRTDSWSARVADAKQDEGVPFRASLPPHRVHELDYDRLNDEWACEPVFGIVVGRCRVETETLAADVRSLGGTVMFFGPDGAPLTLELSAPVTAILRRLKAAFDPVNRLRPLPVQPQ